MKRSAFLDQAKFVLHLPNVRHILTFGNIFPQVQCELREDCWTVLVLPRSKSEPSISAPSTHPSPMNLSVLCTSLTNVFYITVANVPITNKPCSTHLSRATFRLLCGQGQFRYVGSSYIEIKINNKSILHNTVFSKNVELKWSSLLSPIHLSFLWLIVSSV